MDSLEILRETRATAPKRNERLALIYLAFAKGAIIYDMTNKLRPWTDPIKRYEEKLDREIHYKITHTQFAVTTTVSITPLVTCMLTDSRGTFAPRVDPASTTIYTNTLGTDEWRFERVNGCWAIRQFVFRIDPEQHLRKPCELDWPQKQ